MRALTVLEKSMEQVDPISQGFQCPHPMVNALLKPTKAVATRRGRNGSPCARMRIAETTAEAVVTVDSPPREVEETAHAVAYRSPSSIKK